jgi:hypothetical protein
MARMAGDTALIKLNVPDYDLTTLSVGKKYSTGDKGNVSIIDSFLYANEYVIYGLIALTILILSMIAYWLLRSYRARRAGRESGDRP